METVDTRGMSCPAPIIEAKRALKRIKGTFKIVTDNKVSLENLKRFLNDNGCRFNVHENAGQWDITVSSDGDILLTDPAGYCTIGSGPVIENGYVIILNSQFMGDGEEELGRKMMNNFLKTLAGADKLPSHILLYGSGVLVPEKSSPHAEWLRKLEKHGVTLLCCGTSVSHYGIGDNLAAGKVSNMLETIEITSAATKIFNI